MNQLFSSYKNFKTDNETFDTIIIGSGISGLALGSLLSKQGKRVLLLEQHYTPGGLTHTFKRNEYEWDVGLHYVGDVGTSSQIKKVFDYVCETPIEWADMGDVYDRAFFGDQKFEFKKGRKQFTDYFINLFPDQKAGIQKYVKLLYAMEDYSLFYYGEKVVPAFISKVLGRWMRLRYLKYAGRTTQSIMDELFTNDKLKAVLTAQFGDVGLPPSQSSFAMHAGVARHYLDGGFYPVGGSSVLFKKIAPVILKSGGQILVRAQVAEIIIENQKATGVKMEDGKTFHANRVVSTTGIDITYNKLLPPKIQQQFDLPKVLHDLQPSTSYYCLYLALNGSAQSLNIPKSNFWIFPENFNHDENVNNYLSGKSNELPVVYISFPGAKDPDFQNRFPDKCTIEIIALTNYSKFKNWENQKWKHRDEEYNHLKENLGNQLLDYLYKYLPQTKDKVEYHELSTPLSVKHFTGHRYGELYGLNHNPQRFNNPVLKPHTPIKNLYLSGQDIATAGIAGGLMSSVICMSHITNSNYLKKIVNS